MERNSIPGCILHINSGTKPITQPFDNESSMVLGIVNLKWILIAQSLLWSL